MSPKTTTKPTNANQVTQSGVADLIDAPAGAPKTVLRVPPKRSVVGIDFDFILKDEVKQCIEFWKSQGKTAYITITNPHSVMVCRRDPAMRAATQQADMTLPDGVGVILAAKLLGYGRKHRATGPALMLTLCDQGRAHGLRHFFYGGAPGIAEKLAENLQALFPGMIVAGTCCPAFRTDVQREDDRVIGQINRAQPDIVWVGLGAPKQEKWMHLHRGEVQTTAMIGVGAAFDFHSGNVPWAPAIVRKLGLEWAYRFAQHPRRMWRRNLDSPLFLGLAAIQRLSNLMLGRAPEPNAAAPASDTPSSRHRDTPAAPTRTVLGEMLDEPMEVGTDRAHTHRRHAGSV